MQFKSHVNHPCDLYMTVCDSLIETLVKLVTSEPTADANVVTLIKCKNIKTCECYVKKGQQLLWLPNLQWNMHLC